MKGQAELKRLTEEQARQKLEAIRWPNGPVCPFCGCTEFYSFTGLAGARGLRQCKNKGAEGKAKCFKQYTVTVGTVMERSHVKLWQWVYAFAAMCASKKGISSHQLHRELGVTYKTAWFVAHRVRYALRMEPEGLLGGPGAVVVVDESFVGGKPRRAHAYPLKEKTPVVTLVERGGNARTFVTNDVKATTLRSHMDQHTDKRSMLMTDEGGWYKRVGKEYADHRTVIHSTREYGRTDSDGVQVNNNEAEAYFSLLKRGLYGTFHHCSPEHLQKVVDEFDFRWNTRKMSDTERTFKALGQVGGKRLYYRKPKGLIQAGE